MDEETPRKRQKGSEDAATKKGAIKDTKARKPASSGRTVAFNRAVGKKTNEKFNSAGKKRAAQATGTPTDNITQNGGAPSFLVWRGYPDQHGQPLQGIDPHRGAIPNQPPLSSFSEQFPPLTDPTFNPYLAGHAQQQTHPGFFAAPYFQHIQPTDYMSAMSGVSFDATSSFFVQQDQTGLTSDADGREGNLDASAAGFQQDGSMFVQRADQREGDTVLEQGENHEQQQLGETVGDDTGVPADLGTDQDETFGHGEGQVAYHFQLRGDGDSGEQQDTHMDATEDEEKKVNSKEVERKHQEEMAECGNGPAERCVFLANKARKMVMDKKTSKEDALRMVTVQQYFALLANGRSKVEISELLATSLHRGVYFAKKLRADAQVFEKRGSLPPITQGKHTKIPSLLVQNGGVLQNRLDEYLYGTPHVSRTTLSLKKYLDSFLRATNFVGPHGKQVTSISMETCRIWLKKFEKVKYIKGSKLQSLSRSHTSADLLQPDHTATLPALPTIPRLPQPLPLHHAAHGGMGIGQHGAFGENPFGNHADPHSFLHAHGMFQHHQHAFGAHDPLHAQGAARVFPAPQLHHTSLPSLLPQ